ncbi:brix domain-containing protein [Nannizzia gypsea CBS 118893]|uniref:Brix domain-containing protein n=1 Tax=Arthroderma gypseum (strain ATCC MYA-4604 / CBS 118893) TaxID=535722 RepID=E4UU93_ARTGP|nr:brix domain-containing protein [Nannizzia gypsea CBS 118893]EFR00860.1 brix domain-containing protein [Nannizzia gypsea CBS 118893]
MGKSNGPRSSGMDYKPANKLKRQQLHIKRKQTKDAETRAFRFARRKEEAKNPQLKAERLKRNVPLTLERKRVWDDAGSDVEDGLGLSFDVERIKRRKQEAEEEQKDEDLIPEDKEGSEEGDDGSDDVDSMVDFDSDDEDEQEKEDRLSDKDRRKNRVPSATERATSPTQSTRSTNIDLAPDALAAKFPSLFPTEAPPPPKILITTSLNSTLHKEAKVLTEFFPSSVYIRRSAHRYGHKFSVREISAFAANRNYTAVVVVEEDLKRVSGLTIVHLPVGPTFHFSISNWIEGKKLPGHGNPTNHWPELILNNFRTPLGLLTAHLFRTLFPPQPEFQGRQVVTLHNQRDYIFVRRHRYVFRDKRETEKCVVDANGVEMKGVEGIRAGLQELGPRFTLKLRRIDKGIQRKSGQDWEWKGRMEKVRTKFQL